MLRGIWNSQNDVLKNELDRCWWVTYTDEYERMNSKMTLRKANKARTSYPDVRWTVAVIWAWAEE